MEVYRLDVVAFCLLLRYSLSAIFDTRSPLLIHFADFKSSHPLLIYLAAMTPFLYYTPGLVFVSLLIVHLLPQLRPQLSFVRNFRGNRFFVDSFKLIPSTVTLSRLPDVSNASQPPIYPLHFPDRLFLFSPSDFSNYRLFYFSSALSLFSVALIYSPTQSK